jgi:dipeptide transport system substrate-binding protein
LDRLIFAVTVDTDVRVQRVKAGECLVGHPIKPPSVAAFDGSSKVSVLRNSPLAISFLALNVQHKPLADVRLRQALWLAIDKKTYIQANNAGFATPAVSFLPPAVWSHDKTLQERADVERARALVKASGYDGSPLTMFFGSGGERKRAAELLQADWAKAGVQVKVIAMELGEMFKRAGQGEHDLMLMSSYGDINDPDNFFGPNLSCAAAALGGSNKSRWCHPRFDALLDAANRTTDINRRTDFYVQAQRLVYDEVPVIPLVYPMVMTALNQRVTGFVASPLNIADFRSVSVKP